MANGGIQRVEIVGSGGGSGDAVTAKPFKSIGVACEDTSTWTSDTTGTGGRYTIIEDIAPFMSPDAATSLNDLVINYNHQGNNVQFDMRFMLLTKVENTLNPTYYIPSSGMVIQSFPAQGAANAALSGAVLFSNDSYGAVAASIDVSPFTGLPPFNDFNTFPTITPSNYKNNVQNHNGIIPETEVDCGAAGVYTVKTVLYMAYIPVSNSQILINFNTVSGGFSQ